MKIPIDAYRIQVHSSSQFFRLWILRTQYYIKRKENNLVLSLLPREYLLIFDILDNSLGRKTYSHLEVSWLRRHRWEVWGGTRSFLSRNTCEAFKTTELNNTRKVPVYADLFCFLFLFDTRGLTRNLVLAKQAFTPLS